MARAVDISNYSSELTPEALEAWKADGVELVIVQAVDPPAGYPVGVTREQIHRCLDAGLTVDAYIWLWFDLNITDIEHKVALLEGLPIRQLWLDVEDQSAVRYDQATCEMKVAHALEICDAFVTKLSRRTGIYSAPWFWTASQYMNNSYAFSNRLLWDANYDGVADTTYGFYQYGGWTECAIKQYAGTSELHGVSGIDLDVLSDAEALTLTEPVPPPDCSAYKDALDRAVQRLWIEAGKKTTISKKIIKEIADEAFAALEAG